VRAADGASLGVRNVLLRMSSRQEIQPAAVSPPADILDRPEAGAKVIRGGAIRASAYVMTILLTAATVPLMTRHLGVADFGRFVTASSVVMIVAGVTEFGLSGIGMREYALAAPGQRRALLANLLGLRTALTLAGLAMAALLMALAAYPRVVVAGMLVSGFGLLLLNIQQTYSISLTAQLDWGVASAFELVNAVVVAAGTVLLVLIGAQLFPFFFVSVASSAAALLAAMVYLRGRVSLLPRFQLAHWRDLVRDTLPYAAAATVGIFYPRVGLLVVSLISSAHQTGYYSTAFKVVEVIGGTSGLIASSAFPLFARAGRDDHDRLRYAVGKVGDTALIAGVYVSLSLVAAAPFVIEVLGGTAFAPAVPVLRLQALALLGGFLAATWSYTLLSLRMHGDLLRVTLVALLVSIALSAALVPGLGAEGASIASAVCEFVAAGGYLLALSRRHPHLRPSLETLPGVALAAAPAAAMLWLGLPSVAEWAIASAVYFVLLAITRTFPRELLDVLKRRAPGDSSPASPPPPPAN
jgi:O-antigen/teichoic acid export membrane protein